VVIREFAEWEKADASNNFTPEEGGWPEGMARSDVNNAARADMGALRRFYDDPEWLNLTVNATITRINATQLDIVGQDATQYLTVGRRVKMTGGTPSPVYATVVDSDFGVPDTQVELNEFVGHTGVPTTPTLVELHHSPNISSSVFLDDIFVRVTTLTSAAIQVAIDALESDKGGVIILEAGETYVMSEQIDIGHGFSEGKIRIIGRGAILRADAALDGFPMFQLQDNLAAVIEVNTIFEEIIFDGNSAAMTALHDGIPTVQVGGNIRNVWILKCGFNDTWSHGIEVQGGCNKVWISDCQFKDIGKHGINGTDGGNNVDQIYVSRCTFDNVNAQNTATAAGIRPAGRWKITDCSFIGMDHPSDAQVGITTKIKTAGSPNDASGKETTIIGCRFEGTGLNARGIYVRGRDTTISACMFLLTGAGTEGVQVENSGNICERHIITGCNFLNCQHAIRLEASSEDCIVSGNTFDGCPFPITDAGKRNKISGNLMTDGIDGITLSSTAEDTMVSGNTIDTFTSDGITVNSATDVQLLDNLTNNISVLHVNDSGTRTGERGGFNGSVLVHVLEDSADGLSLTTTEQLITDGAGSDMLEAIGAHADGIRVWEVESAMVSGEWEADSNINPVIISLWHGTNSLATITDDTLICTGLITMMGGTLGPDVDVGDSWQCILPQVEFTPASGDDVYMAIAMTTGTLGLDVKGTTDSRYTLFRVRPK